MERFIIKDKSKVFDNQSNTILLKFSALHEMKCKSMGSLATLPESEHWHFQKPKEKGTLELTWDKKNNALYWHYTSTRYAEWMDLIIAEFKSFISNYSPTEKLT